MIVATEVIVPWIRSPLWSATCISITLSIVQLANEAGLSNKFLGVASNYLAKVCTGDQVQVGIRSSAATFHLPEDPSVPVVMFATGSGIAPMRGFTQRVEQAKSGRNVGKMVLDVGHRNRISSGRLRIHLVADTFKSDRVLYDKELIYEYFLAGAKFYTSGSPPVANALKESLISLAKIRHSDWDDERPARKWEFTQKERLATDVFA
ncbi:hypothetical protein M422DRAFT_243734 [Sphaerobolus stellatus SS14]|nr:hypothetical protein M422DRAFT_243734 [Sphaerobolus stellatus SS14]